MSISRRALLTASAGLTAIAAARASARTTAKTPRIAQARRVIKEILAANAIPALSIAVMKGEELVWSEAFGKANVELDVAATPAHRFRLGSVSKVVTATLAARLAVNGGVDLDAPIGSYLPDLPLAHRATTLAQLLTHRGGIRHYLDRDTARDAPGGSIDQRNYMNNAEVLAVFINDPLVAPPGEKVIYSTFGYTLASIVMEAAAGATFPELVQREIGTPLGLQSLGLDAPRSIVRNRVSGYVPVAHTLSVRPKIETSWANAPMNNPAYKWPGGGLLATPNDLAAFGAAHLPRGKLSPQVRELLFTVRTEATDRSPPLGLGWRIDRDASQRLRLHHAGGQDGARASLVVYPDEGLSIAFATNITGAPGDVNGPSAQIADAFIDA